MARRNVDVIRGGLEAQVAEDWPTALATLHEDVEIHDFDIPDAGVYRGHDGYLAWLERWSEGWASWRIEDLDFRPAGPDGVVVLFRMIATGAGSGIEIARADAVLYRLREGRIVRMEYFNDQREALDAAGLPE